LKQLYKYDCGPTRVNFAFIRKNYKI